MCASRPGWRNRGRKPFAEDNDRKKRQLIFGKRTGTTRISPE
jgi:hypothetical protein